LPTFVLLNCNVNACRLFNLLQNIFCSEPRTQENKKQLLCYSLRRYFLRREIYFFLEFFYSKKLKFQNVKSSRFLRAVTIISLIFFIRKQDYLERYSSNFLELQLIFLVKNKITMIQQALDRISNWKYFSNFSNFTIYRSYRFSSDFRLSHVFTFPLDKIQKKY